MSARAWIWLAPLLVVGCAMGQQASQKKGDTHEAARINAQMGIEYLRKGDTELARDKLLKAIELDPENADAHGALGLLYANTGEVGKAEKHYEKSLRLEPDDPNVLNNYGTMLCAQGKYEKADLAFRRASRNSRYQAPALALTNAGVCARKMQDDTRAEAYFREALKHNPDFADALGQLALLSADQARYLNARGFLQRYEALQAPMTRDMLLLGIRIELALGDRDAAQRYAQSLRSEYPGQPYDSSLEDGSRAAGKPAPDQHETQTYRP
jgi:type IV pilus assembly protein PilF